MRRLVHLRWMLLWPALLAAQPASLFPPERLELLQRAVDEVFRLDHAQAAAICRDYITRWPDDPAGYAFLARTYWAEELASQQLFNIDRFTASGFFSESSRYRATVPAARERRFREASGQAIRKAKARLQAKPSDPAARFSLGVAYQNLASFEAALKTNWWQAVIYGNRAVRTHRDLIARQPSCADARVTLGVYEYAAGSVPWGLRWLTFLLGYRGNKETGKRELRAAAEQGVLAAADARLVLVLFHSLDKEFDSAYAQLARLLERYPRNYLVHLNMAAVDTRRGRHAAALTTYNTILSMVNARSNGYQRLTRAVLYNQMAAAARAAGDLRVSERWLRQSLEESALPARTAAIAHLELGKTLDRMGNRTEAIDQYRAVERAEDFAGSRVEAQRYLKSAFTGAPAR